MSNVDREKEELSDQCAAGRWLAGATEAARKLAEAKAVTAAIKGR